MIPIILVYDDQDFDPTEEEGLGFFFQACATDIKAHINLNNNLALTEIISESISQNLVSETLEKFQGTNFILLAYSHGQADALLYNNKQLPYITAKDHVHLLKDSLIYTWACSCGEELGPKAVNEGCKAFIGYNDLVIAGTWLTDIFVNTANSGLISFLSGLSIEESRKEMIRNYNINIDSVYKESSMVGSLLRRNRDALVFLGENLKITLSDWEAL